MKWHLSILSWKQWNQEPAARGYWACVPWYFVLAWRAVHFTFLKVDIGQTLHYSGPIPLHLLLFSQHLFCFAFLRLTWTSVLLLFSPHLPYRGAFITVYTFRPYVTHCISSSLTLKVVKWLASILKKGWGVRNLARQLKEDLVIKMWKSINFYNMVLFLCCLSTPFIAMDTFNLLKIRASEHW